MKIEDLLDEVLKQDASDLHLSVGVYPTVRVDGTLRPLASYKKLTKDSIKELVFSVLNETQKDIFIRDKELDFSFAYGDLARFRANAYHQKSNISMSLRLIPSQIRSIDELGMPKTCEKFSNYSQGLVLATAARNKAQDMINRDYFSHNTPDGKTPWTFMTAAGYNYIYAGENLAMNFTVAEDVMAAWMASGGHRANILSTNFKELGVGVVQGEFSGYTTIMVVQMFGTQAVAVYDNAEKSPAPVKKAPEKAVIPVTVDYTKVINLSSDFVKKRVKDFSEAFGEFKSLFIET